MRWIYRSLVGDDGTAHCPECLTEVDPDDAFCPNCAAPLKEGVMDDLESHLGQPADDEGRPRPAPAAASSGRQAWAPAERAAFLAGLPPDRPFSRSLDGEGNTWDRRLADAERFVAQTEADLAAAAADMRERTRWLAEEHIHERAAALDPETRSEVRRVMSAESRWRAAEEAYTLARRRLDTLLEQAPPSIGEMEAQAGPNPSPMWREPPSQLASYWDEP